MSVSLVDGATVYVVAEYDPEVAISAVSNAVEAVCSSADHDYVAGDILVMKSGWSRLNDKVARVKSVTADAFTLEGIDTSDIGLYPAGGGGGSARKVNTWQQIQQVLEFTIAGGEQNFAEYSLLEEDVQRQIPTTKTPTTATIRIADDVSLPWYPILSKANDDRIPRALYVRLPSGSKLYYNGYMTLNKTPSMAKGEVMALTSTMSLTSEQTRYAA